MEFLNNPWFIGIGGGILSGLIVTFISRALLSRRDQREYAQKVMAANREVVYAVRPGISENLVPTPEVLDSLVEATARKYGVDRKDLYRPAEIAQDLMKEVMDSSFISAKAKEDYCTKLGGLSEPKTTKPAIRAITTTSSSKNWRPQGVEEYRSRMVSMMSIMMGVLAATMTALLAFSREGFFSSLSNEAKDQFTTLLLPALLTMAATGLSIGLMSLLKELQKRSDERRRDPDKKDLESEENKKDSK